MEKLTVKHVITEDRGAGNSDFYAVTLADTRKAWGKPPIAALPIENHKYAVLFAAAPDLLTTLERIAAADPKNSRFAELVKSEARAAVRAAQEG